MGIQCPNCDRGFGIRWMPSFATSWQCRCGVTVQHTARSFLEAWLRSWLPPGFIMGAAGFWLLNISGALHSAHATAHPLLLAAAGGLGMATCFGCIFSPLGWLLAYHRGIPFSRGDQLRAAAMCAVLLALLAGCLVAVAGLLHS
jgi:hypothetical protein